jgi:nicotinamide-nucleotide amidase
MKAEIIAVGTELLLGNIVNTNATYLSIELASLGIDMYYQSVVGDNFDRIVSTVKQAVDRSDIVIMTGGLGPTPDDLSKDAAAFALGLEMSLNQEILDGIASYFKNSGRTMSESNARQAYFPSTRCTVFPNENGTAPGCAMESENGSVVILMPGVPFEMKKMFSTYVKPFLERKSNRTIVSKNILIAGLGESYLTSLIPEYINGSDPTVSPYCKPGLVTLRVTSADSTKEKAELKVDKTVRELCDFFGKNVCGIDVESIEQTVVELLSKKNLKLATAESCTAGKISSAITNIAGASKVFDFGASTYSNEMKQKLLGVKQKTLEIFGAVSAQTALEMSEGIRKFANADIGVSVTGVAGPGQSEEKPAGLVYISLNDKFHSWVMKLMVVKAENDREKVRNNATVHALNLVRRYLEYYPEVMPDFTNKETAVCFLPENAAVNELQK